MDPLYSIHSSTLAAKAAELRGGLQRLQPGLIAVSGGIDSRVLFAVARTADLNFLPVFFSGPHLSPEEQRQGRKLLAAWGGHGHVLEVNPLLDESVRANEALRCYHCKRLLFTTAQQLGHYLERPHILEGSHREDLGDYRPGRKALEELGIFSPLAQAGLDKEDIRSLARIMQLDLPEQPSRPCLLTRFAYGLRPVPEKLPQIGRFEDEMRRYGFRDFRLRVLAQESHVLQIAEAEKELYPTRKEELEPALSRLGLKPCSVRFSPRVSGFFDGNGSSGA
ncbi:MAG: PP-loop superfamily ATP-utilizing enzyme [Desulfohalobiaceae bacterium]|nr:PP-loop superfamily ATP-utilizing enzyme [Desulfohalobiaceae bacterium]